MNATGHEMVRKITKSTDGGATFSDISGNFYDGTKHTSACHLIDAQTCLVTCVDWAKGESGIWRAADGGAAWTRVCARCPTPGRAAGNYPRLSDRV